MALAYMNGIFERVTNYSMTPQRRLIGCLTQKAKRNLLVRFGCKVKLGNGPYGLLRGLTEFSNIKRTVTIAVS